MSARGLTAITCALALASSLLVVSCGHDKSSKPAATATATPTASPRRANLVTQADLRKTAAGSPERALFEFVRSVQFEDVEGAIGMLTPAAIAEGQRPRLRAAVERIGELLGRPNVDEVIRIDPRHVRLRAFLQSYDAAGKLTLRVPTTFPMARLDGQWRIDSPRLLLTTYDDLQAGAAGG